jgi:hypothetical protein
MKYGLSEWLYVKWGIESAYVIITKEYQVNIQWNNRGYGKVWVTTTDTLHPSLIEKNTRQIVYWSDPSDEGRVKKVKELTKDSGVECWLEMGWFKGRIEGKVGKKNKLRREG